MQSSNLSALTQYRNDVCVSVIVRTHRHAPENAQDQIEAKNLLAEAHERLKSEHGDDVATSLTQKLQTLVDSFDWNVAQKGALFFASPDFSTSLTVPHAPRSRVVVDETFATRDLVFSEQRSASYRVVVLSAKPTRVFDAHRDELVEVTSGAFPLKHSGPGGELRLPAPRGVNLSRYRDEKVREFFREVDAGLQELQRENPRPLVVLGVDRFLAFFRELSGQSRNVVGTVEGSFSDHHSEHQLGELAWPVMKRYLDSQVEETVARLDAATSAGRVASSIDEVWRAAHERRVSVLLVEQDFQFSASIDEDGYLAEGEGVRKLDDAVDELIELCLNAGAEVVFTDEGQLEKHQRMAAILRY